MGVERKRSSDAVGKRPAKDEIQGSQLRQRVALYRAIDEVLEVSGNAFGGDFLIEQSEVFVAVGNERDGYDVSLVAGARVSELMQKHFRTPECKFEGTRIPWG